MFTIREGPDVLVGWMSRIKEVQMYLGGMSVHNKEVFRCVLGAATTTLS